MTIRLRLQLRRDKAGEEIRTLNIQLGRLDGENSKATLGQEDADTPSAVVPKSVPSEHENGAESSESDADRLAVIADLLADLPEAERREVIAALPPAARAAIARLLIGRNRQGGRT